MDRKVDRRPTVLVVEDELIISEVMSEVLQETGFDVRCAASREAAIEAMRGDEPVDAALVDIDLTRWGDGWHVARDAQARWPGMLIVYTSGGAQASLAAERVAGSLFIPKPYSPTGVCDLLRQRMRAA